MGKDALRLVDPADQQETPHHEVPRVQSVAPVAVRFERSPGLFERPRTPAQVARGQGDLRLGDYAPGAGHGLSRTEGSRRPPQQRPGPREIAELRHRDAPECERGCVAAQGDPLQGA